MFCLKQINKYPNQCYSCFLKRISGQRNLSLNKWYPKKESDADSSNLLLEFEGKLIFNSVIESQRMRYGFKKNSKIITGKMRFRERIDTALKTIRPLPLSFKYLKDSTTENGQTMASHSLDNKHSDELADKSSTNFPYHVNTQVSETEPYSKKEAPASVESKVLARKKLLDENVKNWMTSYDNYEYDLVQNEDRSVIRDVGEWKINYGSPNPNGTLSNHPCGGCGAHLHCMDTAIPGYIPSEIFENSYKPGGADLRTILCQRCHFLKEYDIALQVRVSSDDYPKVLQTIPFHTALVVLLVDLTDFPCSIWPGIADILGPKRPIIVVGNKVDLLPKDDEKYLTRVKRVLYDNVKLCGFAGANIKHVDVISATTGYGVENLITAIHSIWRQKGDVYLIGSVNVGKSSLFNALLQSDLCKIQAADLIQRATTSPWPGTTLNLLKFPITNLSGQRSFLRHQRLAKLQKIEGQERHLLADRLKEDNSVKNATLIGRIDRSFDRPVSKDESQDAFSLQGNSNLSGRGKMGLDERHRDYVFGKWCFDTPGVVHPETILHLLTTEELIKTLPKRLIRPETFCIKPGTTLFIAGLARLDYVNGPDSIRITVFRANDLPITLCKIEEADAFYQKLIGSELFAVPIDTGDRLTNWPGLQLAKSFKLVGKSYKESSHDVVLSSAGWTAINCGFNEYEFQAWTPQKKGVYVRDCLLPKAVTLRGPRVRFSVAYKKNKFV